MIEELLNNSQHGWPKNITEKYVKQNIEFKGEIDKSTFIGGGTNFTVSKLD